MAVPFRGCVLRLLAGKCEALGIPLGTAGVTPSPIVPRISLWIPVTGLISFRRRPL